MSPILVIDGHSDSRELLACVLETAGYHPCSAPADRTEAQSPSAVVVNLASVAAAPSLPAQSVPLICLANDEEHDRRARKLGAAAVVRQPVHPDALLRAISEVVSPAW